MSTKIEIDSYFGCKKKFQYIKRYLTNSRGKHFVVSCVCVCVCLCIYIYIEREKERKVVRSVFWQLFFF